VTGQPLLLADCERVRRRVKLDPRTEVRVSFRMSRAEKAEAIKVAEAQGITLSELCRDGLYELHGIGELEGE
jgi:hypothetical protein